MSSPSSTLRYAPELPLPPYAFVPGQKPHPTGDPRGHSFGRKPTLPAAPDPRNWQRSQAFLYGCDLFNAGFYWESHEFWEGLWHACGRTGVVADFLKGLIKLAAAGVKVREGKPEGVRSHAGRAAELFELIRSSLRTGEERFLGLDVQELVQFARGVADHPPLASQEGGSMVVFVEQLLPK